MKSFKNIIIGFATGILMMFSSCTDLSETVYGQLADSTIDMNDPDDVGDFMGKAYAQLRAMYWGWPGYYDLQDECCDLYVTPNRIGIGWGNFYILLHKHLWNNATLNHLNIVWNGCYIGIGYANKCLDVMPEGGYNYASMRFIRAFNYYILLDTWRNIPLETTQELEPGYLPKQASGEDIFDFCVQELLAIKNDLGTNKIHGYPNRYAACMTLAKLYLNANVYSNTNDNSWYEKALAEVNEVINSGSYRLATHYLDNHKSDLNNSSEVIFAIPYDNVNARGNYNVNKALAAAGRAAFGYTGDTPYNGSAAVPQFIDTYDPDDKRLDYTWTYGIQRNATVVNGVTIPNSGDPIAMTQDDWSGTGFLNYSKELHSVDEPGCYQQEGYRIIKSEIVPGQAGTYGNDVPFFRLSDAMFIKAECLLRLGRDEQTAADLITEVRMRSFDDPEKAKRTVADLKSGSIYKYGVRECISTGYNVWDNWIEIPEGGADIELGGLLDDLAWEFIGEHHRRQDLIRFKMGDGRNVFNGKSWFSKRATNETHWNIYPIPRNAMNSNISLVQNPGYQD